MAPYWDDVDIRLAGNVSYEMHSIRSNSLESNRLLSDISSYIATSTGEPFQGTWMLIAEWEEVHPWPHGLNNPIFTLFFPEIPLVSESKKQLIMQDVAICMLCYLLCYLHCTEQYLARTCDYKRYHFIRRLHLSLWRHELGVRTNHRLQCSWWLLRQSPKHWQSERRRDSLSQFTI